MTAAIVGSRGLTEVDVAAYLPEGVTKIVSGGAKGIDTLAERYAREHGIPVEVFLPEYEVYGRSAPLVRNRQIVKAADLIIALWDGKSRGTKYTIDYARNQGKKVEVYTI